MAGSAGRSWRRIILWAIGIAVVVFVLIQLVPYGRSSHSNPSATDPFAWTDSQAEAVARQSCYDCHSNETEWWWATSIAPFSWLVQRDVDEGRAAMNFSTSSPLPPAAEFAGVVNEGEMPPFQYTLIHSGAKLTDGEKQTLVAGYQAALAARGASTGVEAAPEASATPAATATASGDAVAVIGLRCASCHAADRALGYRAGSADEAQALVDDMVRRGAQVTAQEQRLLVQYFTR